MSEIDNVALDLIITDEMKKFIMENREEILRRAVIRLKSEEKKSKEQ